MRTISNWCDTARISQTTLHTRKQEDSLYVMYRGSLRTELS